MCGAPSRRRTVDTIVEFLGQRLEPCLAQLPKQVPHPQWPFPLLLSCSGGCGHVPLTVVVQAHDPYQMDDEDDKRKKACKGMGKPDQTPWLGVEKFPLPAHQNLANSA